MVYALLIPQRVYIMRFNAALLARVIAMMLQYLLLHLRTLLVEQVYLELPLLNVYQRLRSSFVVKLLLWNLEIVFRPEAGTTVYVHRFFELRLTLWLKVHTLLILDLLVLDLVLVEGLKLRFIEIISWGNHQLLGSGCSQLSLLQWALEDLYLVNWMKNIFELLGLLLLVVPVIPRNVRDVVLCLNIVFSLIGCQVLVLLVHQFVSAFPRHHRKQAATLHDVHLSAQRFLSRIIIWLAPFVDLDSPLEMVAGGLWYSYFIDYPSSNRDCSVCIFHQVALHEFVSASVDNLDWPLLTFFILCHLRRLNVVLWEFGPVSNAAVSLVNLVVGHQRPLRQMKRCLA